MNDPSLVDPSTLTTAQLLREVASLEKLSNQRMDAIEKAVTVAHDNLVRVPTEVDKAIGHLREVMLEKFKGIEVQFRERDVRVEQTAKDTKTAVDAALAAQEKSAGKQADSFSLSIGKSETATTKQIDQLGMLIQQYTKASDDKIGDLKERLTRIEGSERGSREAVVTRQTSSAGTVNVLALVIGTLIGISGIVVALISRIQ